MVISPSILSVYKTNLDESLKVLNEVNCQYLHVDVMDNIFVPNYTFDFTFVKVLKEKCNFILDTHIMICNPETEYLKYIEAGSDILTFHYEACDNPLELIRKIKCSGAKAGISIKPNTPVEVLVPLLSEVDLILVMSVEPGFGGQTFKENAVEKIAYLEKQRKSNNYNYLIEVDGGINNYTSKLVKHVGCDIIVVGSYLMNSSNIQETYRLLEKE